MKITQNLGMLLLAIWLILTGFNAFVPAIGGLGINLGIILSVLAVIAGVLILIGK